MSAWKVLLVYAFVAFLSVEASSWARCCPTSCPDIYDPVCARNCQNEKKTFSNKCELDKHNCLYPCQPYVSYTVGACKKDYYHISKPDYHLVPDY